MSSNFDPYHKWLGIPPDEQPPNQYRLLGLREFEDDPDVIDNGADQRATHVRAFQTGNRSVQSQQLLNEIASARVCLLNATSKAEYDAQLRQQMNALSATPLAKESDPKVLSDSVLADVHESPVRKRPSSSRKTVVAAVAVTGCLLLVLLVVFQLGTRNDTGPSGDGSTAVNSEERSEKEKDISAKGVAEPVVTDDSAKSPTSDAATVKPPKSGQPDANADKTVETGEQPLRPAQVKKVQPEQVANEEPLKSPTDPLTGKEYEEELPQKANRHPLPKADRLDRAAEVVREIYKADYEALRTDADRAVLAGELLKDAAETRDDIAGRYVLLRAARTIALEAGNIDLAMQATNQIVDSYDVPELSARASTAIEVAENARTNDQYGAVTNVLLALAKDAVKRDDFDLAVSLSAAATNASTKARDGELRRQTVSTREEIERLKDEFAKINPSLEQLSKDPDDALANDDVGRYYALQLGDWPRAIPFLVNSKSDTLRELAIAESSQKPNALEIADGWWEIADELSGIQEENARSHAIKWYEKSLVHVAGLTKSRVLKRLEAGDDRRIIRRGGTLDVLQAFDAQEQEKTGEWLRVRDGINVEPMSGDSSKWKYIVFPVDIEASRYQLATSFTWTAGAGAFSVGLPTSPEGFALFMVALDSKHCGLQSLDGKGMEKRIANRNFDGLGAMSFVRNKRYEFIVQVKSTAQSINILAIVNDRKLLDWTGDPSRLRGIQRESGLRYYVRVPTGVTFHSIELKIEQGEATLEPSDN